MQPVTAQPTAHCYIHNNTHKKGGKKKRKSLPYGAPWDQIWSTEASWATLHCIRTCSRETAKKPFFFILCVLYSAPACNESWVSRLKDRARDPRWMAARQEDCLCLRTEKVLCSQPLPSPSPCCCIQPTHIAPPPPKPSKFKKLSSISRGRWSHTAAV